MSRRAVSSWRAALALVVFTSTAPSLVAQAQPKAPSAAAPKLTKPPKLVKFVDAPYPASERAAGRTAEVVLRLGISAQGKVEQAVVVESAGAAFDEAATAAARQFVFEPAEIDGAPAPIKILYKYSFTLEAEAPTTAVFDGTVRRRGSHAPLANVTVELGSGTRATTDDQGRFHFEGVAPGKQPLKLSGAGLTELRTEETFEAGKRLDVTYDVEEPAAQAAPGEPADDVEIVIVAPAIEKQIVSTEVSSDQARRVPGTQGDVLKVVESLPGVARSAAGSGALVVWGAAPEDTRVYVDGVRVPRLYHDGGFRSVVHSDLVRSVELAPGGYGASHGRGLGGLVTVDLKPLDDEGFHGSVAADFLDASGSARASVGQLRVAIALRKSWLDALVPAVTSRDVTTLFPIPRYADAQARIAWIRSPHSSVEASAMLSSDATDRTTPSSDPALRKSESRALSWTRFFARYRDVSSDGDDVTVTPWFGTEGSRTTSRFGGTPAELSNDSVVWGLRAASRRKVSDATTLSFGVDGEVTSASLRRTGSITSPPREGDVHVFGAAPSDQVNVDDWKVITLGLAPYGEADLAFLKGAVHVTPGFRLEPYLVSGSRRTPVVGETPSIGFTTSELLLEPRVALTVEVSPKLRWKAAYGRYHQTPLPEDLSAVFGNPLLEASRADHFLAGATARPFESVSVEVTGFYEAQSGLAARSASPSPALAHVLEPSGTGRSFGAQVLLRKDLTSSVFGWVSYGISRSERKDRETASYRLFDFDQTHVLTALVSWAIGAGFEVGARFRVATGFPRTPVVSAYYDAKSGAYQPVFGPVGSERIPAFVDLDARVSKRIALGKTELEAYLDVTNVTNRSNPEELVYSHDYSRRSTIDGLPILPSLGARFSW